MKHLKFFFQCWIYKIIMYFFPFQVLLISDEERREVILDSRAFWPQFHPLQSYIIWLIDWLVSNNTFWYDKLNSAVTLPSLPLDKNNTFAVFEFLTVSLPSGHPCKLYTAMNVMTVGNIFQLYPIHVEFQLNKFCHVEKLPLVCTLRDNNPYTLYTRA